MKWSNGLNAEKKMLQFFPSLKQKNLLSVTKSLQGDNWFEYLGEFAFIFAINSVFESGDQVGRRVLFLKKLEAKKNLLKVFLCARKKGYIGAHYTYLFLFQNDL
jgi:hypothetical protein